MNEPTYSAQRHRWMKTATAVGCFAVFGLVLGVYLRISGNFAFDKGSVGALLVLLFALVAGGLFVAQLADSIARKRGRAVRRTALVLMVLVGLSSWVWVFAATVAGHQTWCVFRLTDADDLTAVLGTGPEDVDIFVPSHPDAVVPDPATRDALGVTRLDYRHVGGWIETTLVYRLGKARVYFDLDNEDHDDPPIWTHPRIALDGLELEDIEAVWGPALVESGERSPEPHRYWRSGDLVVDFVADSHECGESNFLLFRRYRPFIEVLGPSPEQPLADFEGRLLGAILDDLGVRPSRLYNAGRTAEVRLRGEEAYPLSLELDMSVSRRIVAWRLSFPSSADHERLGAELEQRLGPSKPTTNKRSKGVEHRLSTTRADLRWSISAFGVTLAAESPEPSSRP